MNPTTVGKPFIDAPGTFMPDMEPRYKEYGFGMFGVKLMRMERHGMKAAGPPHNKGISWEKFTEHRGYAAPGYIPKHPKDGELAPDGKIFAVDGSGKESTLLEEVRRGGASNLPWPSMRLEEEPRTFHGLPRRPRRRPRPLARTGSSSLSTA